MGTEGLFLRRRKRCRLTIPYRTRLFVAHARPGPRVPTRVLYAEQGKRVRIPNMRPSEAADFGGRVAVIMKCILGLLGRAAFAKAGH